MRTIRRGLSQILIWSAVSAAGLAIGIPASGQSKGGGKPTPPPPNIRRPICFCGPTRPKQHSLLRCDLGGESIINVNTGVHWASWPRWSPDGSMIGCYHKILDRDTALMVMTRDADSEKAVMTRDQFNAWNLSRPGVLDSEFHPTLAFVHNCWLGNNAFVVTGRTTYDASFFGGQPGTVVTCNRLFIVDAEGTITPLTETAALGTTVSDSSPHWSPALDKIVFVGTRAGGPQLFTINPDGTGLTQITNFGSLLWPNHVAWSPAGDRLAMATQTNTKLVILDVDLSQPNPGTGLGGRVTAVLPFKGAPNARMYMPCWSPDGRRIGYRHSQYVSETGGYAAGDYILIADVETGAETIVVGPKGDVSGPDWDPLDFLP